MHLVRRASIRVALTVVGLLLVVGVAGARPADEAFTYRFRVVGFSMTGSAAYWGTSATIQYRLLQPSVDKTIAYLGSRPTNPRAASTLTYAGPIVDVAGTATYTSRDPSCASTFEYRPAGNKIVQVYVDLHPRFGAKRASASVSRIPIATPRPGEDGTQPDYTTKPRPKCGKAEMGNAYLDAVGFVPVAQLAKKRVTFEGLGKRGPYAWRITVVLQRLSYRRIDCSTHPGC